MAKFYSSAVPEYQADKEQFEFVQMKDDIADATFQDKPIGFFKDAMLRFCRSKVSIVAFVGIVIILFMAIFMPMMSHWHYNYKYCGLEDGTYFWMGTDYLGRDLWVRMWRGARVSLVIAFISVICNVFIGIVYGSIAGYYGGKIDMVMMRITEIIGAFPEIVVVTLFILFFGTGMLSIILCLVVQNWIGTARMIRSQFYRYKGSEYVLAARTLGVKDMALIFRHILPNSIGPIITRAMIAIPGAIFTESFLAYIGLGIRAPESSIGVLLSQGQKIMQQYPNQVFFPAVVISLLMIAFNMLSNGLRDAFDPTQRGA